MEDAVFLYDQTIEQMARLHAFCGSSRGALSGSGDAQDDIDQVVDLLAKRDLLTFSASLRNFAESANTVQYMRTTYIDTRTLIHPPEPPFSLSDGKSLTLYQALSRIIHSRTLRICCTSFDFWLVTHKSEQELYSSVCEPKIVVEPTLVVCTEHDPSTVLSLRDLIDTSCTFLNRTAETLAKNHGIYLSREYR